MSRTIAFKNKYMGKLVDVTPTWGHPGQCVSLVQRFIIEELGVKAKARGNGEAWRTCLINEGLGFRVERKDLRRGDIIAWPGKLGHVAICLGGDEIFQQVGTKPPIDPKVSSARVGSIAYWDKVQGSPGLITRLKNFNDGSSTDKTSDTPVDEPKEEFVTVGGKLTLFKTSNGSSYYGDKTQGLRTRSMKVLDRANGRVRVSTAGHLNSKGTGPAFDVGSFWIDLGGNVSTKPPVNKPVEKPKPKTVRLSGKTRLFVSSGGTATYPQVPKKTYDHYTNLKARTVNVVDEVPGRVRVRIPGFSPELIWINKSELK